MTERELLANVRELAGWLSWLCYHTHDSRRSDPGFPDLVLVRGERILFVELKTAKGKVSQEQTEWVTALAFAGAEVFVWRPAEWSSGAIEAELRKGK